VTLLMVLQLRPWSACVTTYVTTPLTTLSQCSLHMTTSLLAICCLDDFICLMLVFNEGSDVTPTNFETWTALRNLS